MPAIPHDQPDRTGSGPQAPLVYLVAGEHSGDNLGAGLMAALKEATAGDVRFAGIGGPMMAAQGLQSLFPIRELALMGLAEILPHLPNLLRRMRQTVDDIAVRRPDIVVTIDAPDFCLRLARRVRPTGIPLVHYVAPQIWAWRPGRGRKLAAILDHVLALLPFEPDFFARYGVPCTYVGHPVLQSGAGAGDAAAFRGAHDIAADRTLIAVLPGSRPGEISRTLPVYAETLARLAAKRSDLVAMVATVEAVAGEVAQAMARWPLPAVLVTDDRQKHDGFAASRAALAKSGTVNLELALADVPMVVCYRLHPITAFIGRRLVAVEHASLVNLLAGRRIVPEFLQENFRPEPLAETLEELLGDGEARAAQRRGLAAVRALLADIPGRPSDVAAKTVLGVLAGRRAAGLADRPV